MEKVLSKCGFLLSCRLSNSPFFTKLNNVRPHKRTFSHWSTDKLGEGNLGHVAALAPFLTQPEFVKALLHSEDSHGSVVCRKQDGDWCIYLQFSVHKNLNNMYRNVGKSSKLGCLMSLVWRKYCEDLAFFVPCRLCQVRKALW